MTHHDLLGKILAGLHLRGRLRRAEDLQPLFLKRVYYAQRQRMLWSDDRQIDLILFCEGDEPTSLSLMFTFVAICFMPGLPGAA